VGVAVGVAIGVAVDVAVGVAADVAVGVDVGVAVGVGVIGVPPRTMNRWRPGIALPNELWISPVDWFASRNAPFVAEPLISKKVPSVPVPFE